MTNYFAVKPKDIFNLRTGDPNILSQWVALSNVLTPQMMKACCDNMDTVLIYWCNFKLYNELVSCVCLYVSILFLFTLRLR